MKLPWRALWIVNNALTPDFIYTFINVNHQNSAQAYILYMSLLISPPQIPAQSTQLREN